MFNPDGSLRENVVVEPPAEPVDIPAIQNTGAARPAPDPVQPEMPPADSEFAEEAEPEMTEFMQFLYSFASSTSFIHLGLIEHPATGRPEVNLPAAQQGIAMLALLREKTVGNLTRDENEFLENLLSDLQMQFVSLRSQAKQPRP